MNRIPNTIYYNVQCSVEIDGSGLWLASFQMAGHIESMFAGAVFFTFSTAFLTIIHYCIIPMVINYYYQPVNNHNITNIDLGSLCAAFGVQKKNVVETVQLSV